MDYLAEARKASDEARHAYEAAVRSVADPIAARPELVANLTRGLCEFFGSIPDVLLRRSRLPRLTLTDPARVEGRHKHKLIIPYGVDAWSLELIRVIPRPGLKRGVSMDKRLLVHLDAGNAVSGWPFYRDNARDVELFLSIVGELVEDPAAAIAKSGENCVWCGRKLTDGASRLRGIGPECFEYLGDWMARLKTAPSIAA